MNRRTLRAVRAEAGFSFVELLVTIIIAALAFAALVPLFVQAQSRNSADNARNIALQIAQDKVEKIRQLDYDQITQGNLESTVTAGGQFGTDWDFTRNGVTRHFTIQYTIVPVPANAPAGREQYKKVEVSVAWTAPPKPVKAAVLQTLVYRQFAGPEITSVNVGPPGIFDINLPDVPTIIGSPVVIDAYLSPEDITSMDATNPDPDLRGWIKFTITSYTGVTVASQDVSTVYNNEPGHYQYAWDNSAAQDGVYRIEITAVSATKTQGSTATLSYPVALRLPPAPTGLVAVPGDRLVSLSWDPSGIGDFHHYELWRGTASGNATHYLDLANPNFTDQPLNNGDTFFYAVCVVDTEGNHSALSGEVSATPAVPSDTVPPSVPAGLAATKLPNTGTISLSWNASTDYGSPATGVLGYIVERSASGAGGWVQLNGSYPNVTYLDSSAGWLSTWYYHVAAVDNAMNVSAFSAPVGPVTTDPQPKYSLTVNNTNGFGIYVWVQNVGTGQWYSTSGVAQTTKPAGVNIKKNKSQAWANLPSGLYNVYASTSTSGSPPLTSQSGSGDLSAGNNSITF